MGVQFVADRPRQPRDAEPDPAGQGQPARAGATAAAPRTTGPQATLQRAGAAPARANGRSHVDTNVDLAAEYGIDEVSLRRVIDRNWTLGPRAADEDSRPCSSPSRVEPATLAQALAELPRLLDPTPRHRSGPARTLESAPVAASSSSAATVARRRSSRTANRDEVASSDADHKALD